MEPCDGLRASALSPRYPEDLRPLRRASREHASPSLSYLSDSLASPADRSIPSSQSAVSAFSPVSLASVRRVKAVLRQEGDTSMFASPTSCPCLSVPPVSPLSVPSSSRVSKRPAVGSAASVALSEFTTPDKARTDDFASLASSFLPASSLPPSSCCPSRSHSCPSSPNGAPSSFPLLSSRLRRYRSSSQVCVDDAHATPPSFSRSLSLPVTCRLSASTSLPARDHEWRLENSAREKHETRRLSFYSFFSSADVGTEGGDSPKSFLGTTLAQPQRQTRSLDRASEETRVFHTGEGDGLYVACLTPLLPAGLRGKGRDVASEDNLGPGARDAVRGSGLTAEESSEKRGRIPFEAPHGASCAAPTDAGSREGNAPRVASGVAGNSLNAASETLLAQERRRRETAGREATARSGIWAATEEQHAGGGRIEKGEVYGQNSHGQQLSLETRQEESATRPVLQIPPGLGFRHGRPEPRGDGPRETHERDEQSPTGRRACQERESSNAGGLLGSEPAPATAASSAGFGRTRQTGESPALASSAERRRTRQLTQKAEKERPSRLFFLDSEERATVETGLPSIDASSCPIPPSRSSPMPHPSVPVTLVRGGRVTINKPEFSEALRGRDQIRRGSSGERGEAEGRHNETACRRNRQGNRPGSGRAGSEHAGPSRLSVDEGEGGTGLGRCQGEVEQEERGETETEPQTCTDGTTPSSSSASCASLGSKPGGALEKELTETLPPRRPPLPANEATSSPEGEDWLEERRRTDSEDEGNPERGRGDGEEHREGDVDCAFDPADPHSLFSLPLVAEGATDSLDTSPESAVPIIFRVFDAQGSLCPSCRRQLQPPAPRSARRESRAEQGLARFSTSSLPSLPSLSSFAPAFPSFASGGASETSLDLASFFALNGAASCQVPPGSIVFGRDSPAGAGAARRRTESLGAVDGSRASRFFPAPETNAARFPPCRTQPETVTVSSPGSSFPSADASAEKDSRHLSSTSCSPSGNANFQLCSCSALYVVGSPRLLGEWTKRRGVRLRTSASLFPYYVSPPVLVPRHLRAVSYRFARLSNGASSSVSADSFAPSERMHETTQGRPRSEAEGGVCGEVEGEESETACTAFASKRFSGGPRKTENGPSAANRKTGAVVAVRSSHPFTLQRLTEAGPAAGQDGEGEGEKEGTRQGGDAEGGAVVEISAADSSWLRRARSRERTRGTEARAKTTSWFPFCLGVREGNRHEREKQKRRDEGTWDVERVHGDRRLKLPHAAAVISHTFGVNDKGISRHATQHDLVQALALCLGTVDWNAPVFSQGGPWYEMEKPDRAFFVAQADASPSSSCHWEASGTSLAGDYLSFLWSFALLFSRWPTFGARNSATSDRVASCPVSSDSGCLPVGSELGNNPGEGLPDTRSRDFGSFDAPEDGRHAPAPASSSFSSCAAASFPASASSSFSSGASCASSSPLSAARFSAFGAPRGEAVAPLVRVGRVTDVGGVRRRRREEKKLREDKPSVCFKFFALRTLALVAQTEQALYLAAGER
ncbi:conserved hypothetical protein [Neospora caninum Liverpool]|uniref:Uncharacterized protein n=1 Tax=Neospora caninum (strain Liverpool) TaxID=572307 RepID=F0VG60_NEOCL|nr:conserved hypothetical protein [Neospora caninum Liverpool]CBZ52704.1 conserved hypothetical protein [Neospora caninum Liverpool]|eukprot:XP_003882736.1 conserved hypothetical protein [Neospora caninum Liverpool]